MNMKPYTFGSVGYAIINTNNIPCSSFADAEAVAKRLSKKWNDDVIFCEQHTSGAAIFCYNRRDNRSHRVVNESLATPEPQSRYDDVYSKYGKNKATGCPTCGSKFRRGKNKCLCYADIDNDDISNVSQRLEDGFNMVGDDEQ